MFSSWHNVYFIVILHFCKYTIFLQLVTSTWLIQLKMSCKWQTVNICDKILANSLKNGSYCEVVNRCQCLIQFQNKTWHKPYWSSWKTFKQFTTSGFQLEDSSTKMGWYSVICITSGILLIGFFNGWIMPQIIFIHNICSFSMSKILQSQNFSSCKLPVKLWQSYGNLFFSASLSSV